MASPGTQSAQSQQRAQAINLGGQLKPPAPPKPPAQPVLPQVKANAALRPTPYQQSLLDNLQPQTYGFAPTASPYSYEGAAPQQFVPNFDTTELENAWRDKIANRRTQYGADLKQKIIDLGLGDWSGLDQSAQSYLDEPTRQAALANQNSLRALSQQRYERQTANARAQLAARGMLSSGQLTKTTNDALQAKQLQDYSDMRDLINSITGWNQEMADMENQRQQALAAARFGQASY